MAVLLFLTVTSILFSIPAVQTKLAKIATNYINNDFGVDINVKKIDLSALGKIKLEEVLIKDHHKDTLIYANEINASVLGYQKFLNGNLQFSHLFLNDFTLRMKTYKNEKEDNLMLFISKFDSGKTDKKSTFLMTVSQLFLDGGSFFVINENDSSVTSFKQMKGELGDFKIQGADVFSKIESLHFTMNNGIEIENVSTDFSYTSTSISLKNTELQTAKKTKLKGDVSFLANKESYANFLDSVSVNANLKGRLTFKDLHLFYNEFSTQGNVYLSTKVQGTLQNIKLKSLQLDKAPSTKIRGDVHLKNAFNTSKLYVGASVKKSTISVSSLKKILPNLIDDKIVGRFKDLGNFTIIGKTQITNHKLQTNSTISNEELGFADVDVEINNYNNVNEASYKGIISIGGLDVGKIAKDSLVGKITASANVKGRGFTKESLKTNASGRIQSIKYNNYNYKNIALNGLFENKRFDGDMEVNDPNIKLNFKGLIDFSNYIYIADFKSVVDYSDLNKLHLFTRDSISNLKGEASLKVKGRSLNDVAGSIDFKNISYVNPKDTYFFKDFKINSSFKDSIRNIEINSPEIISGNIKGQYRIEELGKLAENALSSIYANYQPVEVSPRQYVDFNFKIYNKIVEILFPDIELAANTRIKGKIISDDANFKLSIKSPQVKIYDNKIKKINVQVDNKNPLFNAQVSIGHINTDYYDISKLKLVNVTLNDTLFFTSEFKGGKKAEEKYDFSFFHTLTPNDESIFGLFKSKMKIKNTTWFFNEKSNRKNRVIYNRKNKHFTIEDILITSKNQDISIKGEADSFSKDIKLNFKNVHLSDIVPSIDSLDVKGVINGGVAYIQKNKKIKPEANFTISDFEINKIKQGNANVVVSSNNLLKYGVDISLKKPKEDPTFTAKGTLDFTGKKSLIDVDVEFLAFNIKPFNSLASGIFDKLRGDTYGSIHIGDEIKNPKMEGDLYLDQAGLYIPLLNIDYDLQGTSVLNLKDQTITFTDVIVQDTKHKTKGDLTGTITHKKFSDWKMDLEIKTKNLLVLNTVEKENSLYYGTGFLEGKAFLKGPVDNLLIGVNGKTKKGTHFVIPVNDVKTAESSDLIHFVNKKTEEDHLKNRWKSLSKKMKGVSLNFNLELTKEAEFEMVIDKVSGSYLKGSGTGNVQIEIDTKDKFDMYGYFVVDKGVYDFKYGIISKPFVVNKGGIIKFNGDPLAAEINLDAVHKVSANPRTILESVTTSQKIPVNLVTRFSGELFNTQRNFDIKFPNLSPTMASELEFKIQNNKTQQFISLLVLNSFFYTNNGGVSGNSIIYGTGADVLSNAFDNILNRGYSNFSIKPVYTVGDKSSVEGIDIEDQLGLVVDYQISDRIIVNGKFGVPIGSNKRTDIIGEGNIDFLLNDKGNLKLSVFNRQNEIQYTEEEQGYTQGIGINYQIDFDTGKELLQKLGVLKVKKKDTVKNTLKDTLDKNKIKKILKFKAQKKEQKTKKDE